MNTDTQIQPKLIARAADCNITRFMACWYDKNYKTLILQGEPTAEELYNAWDNILTEYSDLSGAVLPDTAMKQVIIYLKARNKAVELYCFVCEASLPFVNDAFDNPAAKIIQNSLEKLKRKGYSVTYTDDHPAFLKELKGIAAKESRYHVQLARKKKELEEYEANEAKEPVKENHRVTFVRLLNNLQKFGYSINYETTTVESLAVMVCDYTKLANDNANEN